MTDVKISELSAASAIGDADLFEVVQGAANKKGTGAQLKTYVASGRHMVPIMAPSMSPRQTNGCAPLAHKAGAANQPDVPYLAFDPTAVEYASVCFAMPTSWDEGTVSFIPLWHHPATSTNFGVAWKVRAVAVGNDDLLAATFGTAQASTDTGGTTEDHYAGSESAAITIAGSPAPGDLVCLEIYRDPLDAADTLAVDAHLEGFVLVMTTNAAND